MVVHPQADINFKMGGEAGDGVLSAGLLFSKAASPLYHVFGYPEYPSLIRGGHNSFQIRLTDAPVFSPKKEIDVLLALNEETIKRNFASLKQATKIIYDPEVVASPAEKENTNFLPVPLKRMAQEAGGLFLRNTVGMAAALRLFNIPWPHLEEVINKSFPYREEKVRQQNLEAARLGFKAVKPQLPKEGQLQPPPQKRFVLTGNEALGLAAVASGLGFAAIYPMTPVSNLLHFLKRYEDEFPYQVLQPTDEIEGINITLGAAYSGKKALVATSGGGFSLMVESLGLAAQSETPLVIILGTRPGPSTGLPTWTEQSDLQFALHAGQGDFPRLVFAPGDLNECFALAQQAFFLAEKYQLPAIILVDKFLCESHASCEVESIEKVSPFEGETFKSGMVDSLYPRYQFTHTGVSPRPLPSLTDLLTKTSSDEHDEFGFINEESENRKKMVEKRAKKLAFAQAEVKGYEYVGPQEPELLLVSWGSTKGALREAQSLLMTAGEKVAHLHVNIWSPFPTDKVVNLLNHAQKIVMVENNFSGQGAAVIREKTGIEIKNQLLKYDGRPVYQTEVMDFLEGLTFS